MKTAIYTLGCGPLALTFDHWVDNEARLRIPIDVWFPEIDHAHRLGGAIPRTASQQIELVPTMVGKRIVTLSEHIILAFQKRIRDGLLDPNDLYLYCGNQLIHLDDDGDMLDDWPGGFFTERLSLLR
jgi:hypothetical protein